MRVICSCGERVPKSQYAAHKSHCPKLRKVRAQAVLDKIKSEKSLIQDQEPDEQPTPPSVDYNTYTDEQLHAMAKEAGMKGFNKMKRETLISRLKDEEEII